MCLGARFGCVGASRRCSAELGATTAKTGSRVRRAGPFVLAPRTRITNHGARPKRKRIGEGGGSVMNRVLQLALALTVAAVARVVTVSAQSARFGLGGGLIAPLSTYKDDDEAAWLAGANVEFAIAMSPVGVRVDGLYGETKHRDIGGSPVDGKTRLIGGLPSVVWNIPVPAPIVKPYALAGGGFYNVKITNPNGLLRVSTSEAKFAYWVGAGVQGCVRPAPFFSEGRYVSVRTNPHTTFIPLTVAGTFGAT